MEPNPFYYGKAIPSSCFVNRHLELKEISSDLERGQNIILFSPRRYGKTSLIRIVETKLKQKGLQVFYFDFYHITTITQFYQTFSEIIISQIKSPLQQIVQTVKSLIPSLRPKIVLTEFNTPSVEIGLELPQMAQAKPLGELFNAVEKYLVKKKKRGCIIFDEFQEVVKLPEGERLLQEMRSAFQHHKKTSYAFLGSKNHLMQQVFKNKNSPFYNFGNHIELGTIQKEHWIKFITKRFLGNGYTFAKQVIDELLEITGGHPYYTQLFCAVMWEMYSETKKLELDSIKKVLEKVLSKESHAFQEIWDSIQMKHRKLLQVLSQNTQAEIFSGEFLKQNDFTSIASIQRIIEFLVKRDILIKKGRQYFIHDPLLIRWIVEESIGNPMITLLQSFLH